MDFELEAEVEYDAEWHPLAFDHEFGTARKDEFDLEVVVHDVRVPKISQQIARYLDLPLRRGKHWRKIRRHIRQMTKRRLMDAAEKAAYKHEEA